jgi:hypothetical protein
VTNVRTAHGTAIEVNAHGGSGIADVEVTLTPQSGATATVISGSIADGGYPGTGLVIPHRRPVGGELCDWKREHNRSHNQVRARVEHVFARMRTWKILRDCRLKGDGVHHAMLGIARLHNLVQAA